MSDEGQIPDGDPIQMSEFTLGERYGSEDMCRDLGIERPPVPDIPWDNNNNPEWTITVGGEEKLL